MHALPRLLRMRFLRWSGAALLLVAVVGLLLPQPELYPPEFRFSRTLEDRHGRLLHLALTPDGKYRRYTPLAQISPALIEATLTLEDRHFYDHPGVNPLSMLRAAWGVVSGSARGGGSTITMQTVKNLFLWQGFSYVRKPIEVPLALMVDAVWSKRRIMEAYLNVAEFGNGIFGAQAAARHYFGTSAANLSPAQSALLAATLPAPTRRNPASPDSYMEMYSYDISTRVSKGVNSRCAR